MANFEFPSLEKIIIEIHENQLYNTDWTQTKSRLCGLTFAPSPSCLYFEQPIRFLSANGRGSPWSRPKQHAMNATERERSPLDTGYNVSVI